MIATKKYVDEAIENLSDTIMVDLSCGQYDVRCYAGDLVNRLRSVLIKAGVLTSMKPMVPSMPDRFLLPTYDNIDLHALRADVDLLLEHIGCKVVEKDAQPKKRVLVKVEE